MMRSNEPDRISLIWLIIAAVIAVTIVFDVAYGSGDEVIQSNDMNAQTAGDLAISGSRAYGLSQSLGDIDINDCLASTQWGIIVFQKQGLVENPWCQSQYLDAIGAHEAAAKVRCTTDTLKTIYPIEGECIVAVTAR